MLPCHPRSAGPASSMEDTLFKPCWATSHHEARPAPLRYLAAGRSLKTLRLLRLVTANFSGRLVLRLVNSLPRSSLSSRRPEAARSLLVLHSGTLLLPWSGRTDASVLLQPGTALSSDVTHVTQQHLGQLPDLPDPTDSGSSLLCSILILCGGFPPWLRH